jgi:hypothetical protein
MISALQTFLPIRAERITKLMDVHCVRDRIGLNEDDALMLARLEWGFDISSGEAKRRELRIPPSVVNYFDSNGRPREKALSWEEVQKELLRGAVKSAHVRGRDMEYIEGTTAQFILNCSSTHLNSFIPYQLKLVPGTTYTSGPNGTPKITVDSFVEFLRKRRVR